MADMKIAKMFRIGGVDYNVGYSSNDFTSELKSKLEAIEAGAQVNVIEKITGRDEVRAHLAELGFVVGAQVKVVSEMGGNLILSVKDSRIALDKTMAMRIMV